MFPVILESCNLILETMLFGDTYFIGDKVQKLALDKRQFIMDLFMQPQLMEYEEPLLVK
jgi:hypothetical protein